MEDNRELDKKCGWPLCPYYDGRMHEFVCPTLIQGSEYPCEYNKPKEKVDGE